MYKNLLKNFKNLLPIIALLIFLRPTPVLAQGYQLPSDYTEKQFQHFMQIQNQYVQKQNPTTNTNNVNTSKPKPTPTPYIPFQAYQPDYILKSATSKYFSDQYIYQYLKILPKLPGIFLSIAGICLFLIGLFLGFKFWLFKKALLKNKENGVFLEIKPPARTSQSAFSTEQLFKVLHTQGQSASWWERFFSIKRRLSLEIVSTKEEGIRYIIQTSKKDALVIEKDLLSYLPGVKVSRVSDYLPKDFDSLISKKKQVLISEFELTNHFSIPLQDQKVLGHSDPIAYITGHMTKLATSELVSMQVVLTPITSSFHYKITSTINTLRYRIENGLEIKDIVRKQSLRRKIILLILKAIGILVLLSFWSIILPIHIIMYFLDRADEILPSLPFSFKPKKVLKTPQQEKLYQDIQGKIEGSLFETSIRLLVMVNTKESSDERHDGFISALSTFTSPSFQSLEVQREWTEKFWGLIDFIFRKKLFYKFLYFKFKNRLLSAHASASPILSISEITDLYHLPFTDTTKTEDLVKQHSSELPAPLSLKNNNKLDAVFGENTYGGVTTDIGLTEEERKTHIYMIGRTGSGKTTAMFAMVKEDIEKGKGVAFIDPEGDVSQDLLSCIPQKRINDLIYFNPRDLKHPIGINLLELTPGLDEDEADMEKEVVAEGVVSLFRKVFSKDEADNAHRIEYILRNTIYTAFTIKDATIFTVYDLLNNPAFLKGAIKTLDDENLQNFWKYEFGRAGDYQVVKMVGGVTAKIGRFLFSPTAKRILEQKRSTINFNDILNGKILICNLSQGKLGDDTSRLLGTTILTKIQQAALRRADVPQNKRKQFHLYVDEFQEFATLSFAKMLSRIRKYGVDVCIAEQSTSQQQDRSIVDIILANVTTMICFRTGNPLDEELMLAQFYPHVQKGEIMNLARYKFYIKVSAIESEDPYSGETIKLKVKTDPKNIQKLIDASQKNWAIKYVRPKKKIQTETVSDKRKLLEKEVKIQGKGGLPKKKLK